MSTSAFWRDDEDAPPAAERIIDLPILRPEQDRGARAVGRVIGIGIVYLIAGLIWSWRGAAWVVGRARACWR